MKIRDRSGVVREVSDDHILKDGEALLVEARFMDARRGMIHDASGQPAGQRPGFLLSGANEQAVAAAYAEYDEVLFDRWKTAGVRQGPDPSQTQVAAQASRTFGRPEDALADAYAQYDKDISERWRRGPGQPASSAAQTFGAEPHDSKEDAYAQYDREISERWQRQW